MSKEKLICWDSAVFLELISGKNSKHPERIPLIQSVLSLLKKGEHHLLASTLVYVEVLAKHNPGSAISKFHRVMSNSKQVKTLSVDVGVAKKAQQIRNRVGRMKTPDAVHVATAIAGGAEVLHTFDGLLLALDGKKEVDRLPITRCEVPGVAKQIPPD